MIARIQNLKVGNASGFSLLELLITLVILSIGLLGLGLMQTTGLGLTKTAYARTQAMMLASDIADRIRSNEAVAANYVATTASALGTVGCVSPASCTGNELAASDLTDWSNRVITELPSGKGQVLDPTSTAAACPGNTPTTVVSGFMRVLIKWNEANNSNVEQNRTGGEAGGDCYQFDFVF
jgi:type IV pilus assembly protein PilV